MIVFRIVKEMIGYLEGKILRKHEDRILLRVGQVGYEVLVPAVVMSGLNDKSEGDPLSFYILYQLIERQPAPLLIGFNTEIEKEFFQQLISVAAIGPLRAAKALDRPIADIALAIETNDVESLKNLKGIGARTAQKIIAALSGKMGRYSHLAEAKPLKGTGQKDIADQVLKVLVEQLGHKSAEAKDLIHQALKRNEAISTPEELFDEIYRGKA